MSNPCRQLRELLESNELSFLMEAHNGLSAQIVEEAGFKGIWASGLALSSQFGVRDCNEASWTQVVDMLEFMVDATSIPILLDGDTGYGDFNNVRRLVRKLEQRGVAGVCIEDKIFPKTNSFIDSERQPLTDMEEFCGKIRAAGDSRINPDFCIVARVEALIAGWGQDEALKRAEAYRQAGADAILIHSRSSQPHEILDFCKSWDRRHPLVIVPTKYYSTPTDLFREAGVSTVIWANHTLRASIKAMQLATAEIVRTESLVRVEDRIAPLNEVFRLQGSDELRRAKELYAPQPDTQTDAIILAATQGQALGPLTETKPKGMLSIAGKPILTRLVDDLKKEGVKNCRVVVGFRADAVSLTDCPLIENPRHESTGELTSLELALDRIGSSSIITYGDLLCRSYIIRDLLHAPGEIVIVVDSAIGEERDIVHCSTPDSRAVYQEVAQLRKISQSLSELKRLDGRFIGMMLVRGSGVQSVQKAMRALKQNPDFDSLGLPDLLNHLVESGNSVNVHYIHGHWMDVNSLQDLDRAEQFQLGWS